MLNYQRVLYRIQRVPSSLHISSKPPPVISFWLPSQNADRYLSGVWGVVHEQRHHPAALHIRSQICAVKDAWPEDRMDPMDPKSGTLLTELWELSCGKVPCLIRTCHRTKWAMASKAMLHYQRVDILITWLVVASQKERERESEREREWCYPNYVQLQFDT